MTMLTISVPASSANIGPGFDSVGVAINRYLTLQVNQAHSWEFTHQSPYLPKVIDYQDHLIYQVAKQVATHYETILPPCKVTVQSEIPLARGLGSSASAVIAGIELANQLLDLSLANDEKLLLATKIEGHPDNVAPALLGGFIISVKTEDTVDYVRVDDLPLDLVLYIPDVELKTKDSRDVLPASFSRNDAACASGISNLFIGSLLTNNFQLAGKMMEKDLFHEPYRAKLIPNYDEIKEKAKKFGAYGTVISGAGPTMLSLVPKGEGKALATNMAKHLPNYEISNWKIDYHGLQVK